MTHGYLRQMIFMSGQKLPMQFYLMTCSFSAGQGGWLCVLQKNDRVLVGSNPTKGGSQQNGCSCQLWEISVLFSFLVLSSPATLQSTPKSTPKHTFPETQESVMCVKEWVFWKSELYSLKFGVSPVAQMVKNLLAIQETWIQSQGWGDPLEKGIITHILAWKIPWTEEPGRL